MYIMYNIMYKCIHLIEFNAVVIMQYIYIYRVYYIYIVYSIYIYILDISAHKK